MLGRAVLMLIGMVLTAGPAVGAAAAAGAAGFAAKPTMKKTGDSVRISFAVTTATDVEVAVLDAAGAVVRHLAAGRIGDAAAAAAPPPPLKPGLAQEIAWDGKDDVGRAVAAGAKVRVRLGVGAKFGKLLFAEAGLGWSPRAARVAPDGLLYVLSEHAQTKSTFLLQAYTRDGQYVKTIMPYPADLPAERLTGLPRIKLPDGRWLPGVGMSAFRDLYPDSTGMRPQSMPITSKGRILLVNATRTHNSGQKLTQRVLIVDTDGGTPTDSYLGPITNSDRRVAGLCWLAVSPDEKWIYSAGQQKESGYGEDLTTPPLHAVFRFGFDDKDAPKPFLGELGKAGDDEGHFNQPRGLDTDAAGRLYVCDYANNRVAVFDREGKWVGKIAIDAPDQVAIDRTTGAIYVLSYKIPAGVPPLSPAAVPWYPVNNQKYNTASVKVEQRITRFAKLDAAAGPSVDVGRTYCVMSLDTSEKGKRPTLWLARAFTEIPGVRRGVDKVVDLGDKLAEPVEAIKPRSLPDVYQIAASPVNDDVFIHSYSENRIARVDGQTGEAKVLTVGGNDLAVTPAGQLLTYTLTDYFKALCRVDQFDRGGKPVNFPTTQGNSFRDLPANHWGHIGNGPKGLAVSPRGEIVLIGRRGNEAAVFALTPDGQVRETGRILNTQKADGSPAMDAAGNLYVATAARPADQQVPPALLAAGGKLAESYAGFYGSVVKFGPAGGQFFYPPAADAKEKPAWPPPDADKMLKLAMGKTDVYVSGALWVRPGFTVAPSGGAWCGCYTSRFCVDGFGRVFIPDVGQSSVFVVDAANNELLRFGDYGNEDSIGGNGKVKRPEIPLAWPFAASVGKSGVYVTDFINRRIVRVDLTWAAEEIIEAR